MLSRQADAMKDRERLLAKMIPEPNSGCWLWIGALTTQGYGKTTINGHRTVAHRALFQIENGPVPPGLVLDHKCRVRSCINPDHLEIVTHMENVMRGEGASARNARKTHCKRGHELVGENLLKRKTPGRACATCERVAVVGRKRRYLLRRATPNIIPVTTVKGETL